MPHLPLRPGQENSPPPVDFENVSKWVEQCLLGHHDNAIINAISGMHHDESRRVFDALSSHFNDRTVNVGRRKMRVCLVAAPTAFLSPVQLDESMFSIQDITPFLESFYSHGLLNRDGAGIVLLNRLIDHEVLERTPLSTIYDLSSQILECAKSRSDTLVSAGDFGQGSETSWLPMPDGYYTMRHMLGIVFWEEKKGPPPMLTLNAGDNVEWQRQVANKLLLNALTPEGYSLQVTSVAPMRFFDAVSAATYLMVEKAITTLAIEAREQTRNIQADMTVGYDIDAPGRSEIRIVMFDPAKPEHDITSAAFRLSVMESVETGQIMKGVEDILAQQDIYIRKIQYSNGSVGIAEPKGTH